MSFLHKFLMGKHGILNSHTVSSKNFLEKTSRCGQEEDLFAANNRQLGILGIYSKDTVNNKCSLKTLPAIKSTFLIFFKTPNLLYLLQIKV